MRPDKEFIERRKQDRFNVMDGAFATIKSGHYVVGPIQNISRGGFGFRYIGKKGKIIGSLEVDIFFCGKGIFLQRAKAKAISDFRIDKKASESFPAIRHCCVQFYELTNDQISQLDYFIQKYIDRHSDGDRRKGATSSSSGREMRSFKSILNLSDDLTEQTRQGF